MFDRRVFICSATPKLLERIHTLGDDHLREFDVEVVVMTELVDYERDIEGWGPSIRQAAKRVFIEKLVGEDEVFGDVQELADVLGPGSLAEVFDRWFVLREVEFLEVGPRAWRQMT